MSQAASSAISATATVTPITSNPVARKLEKVISGQQSARGRLHIEDDVLVALESVSDFYPENTKQARQGLRADLERRTIAVSEELIAAFGDVQSALAAVESEVKGMAASCDAMAAQLEAARGDTSALVKTTSGLRDERRLVELRRELLSGFMERFQLRPEEASALGADTPVTDDFFTALKRVRVIHADCRLLLTGDQQRAGLSIMEAMAAKQETAYEKLYRWTQDSCRTLAGSHPDRLRMLKVALDALQTRPILYGYALQELASTRRAYLSRLFITALTRGGDAADVPIEMQAHDPVRYATDMLAWLHEYTAHERELLRSILPPPRISTSDPGTAIAAGEAPHRKAEAEGATLTSAPELAANWGLSDTLADITTGFCQPLKVRLEQVLLSDPGINASYLIAGVIQFYANAIGEIVAGGAHLIALLADLKTMAGKAFEDAAQQHSDGLLLDIQPPSASLSPPPALEETLALFRRVMSAQAVHTVDEPTRKAEVTEVICLVLEPAIQMCNRAASFLSSTDRQTFTVNCAHRIQSTLALYDDTDESMQELEAKINESLPKLVDLQYARIAKESSLARIFAQVHEQQPLGDEEVRAASAAFDSFLMAGPSSTSNKELDLLQSTKIRTKVQAMALDNFFASYELLCRNLLGRTGVFQRSKEEVKSLMI